MLYQLSYTRGLAIAKLPGRPTCMTAQHMPAQTAVLQWWG